MATNGSGHSAATLGRGLDAATRAAQILLGTTFAFAGINKILGLPLEMAAAFEKLGFGIWFRF